MDSTKKKEYITHLASRQNMSAEPVTTTPEAPVQNETPAAEPVAEAPVVEESALVESSQNQEELMKLVIDQRTSLAAPSQPLRKPSLKLQAQWKEREDNERLQTKSKAEALSKA